MNHIIGKKLDGRYEISELIGIGGMADVYKALDIMEDKVVAVKILKNEFAGNEEFLRRFRNESKAIAVLSHPNIVKIFDVGFTEKIQYIVMEYIDGITLKEFIEQQGVIKWKDAVHFSVQILRALQHAHDRGIVHRDIKPQNIMLFPDGTIKVMDFGIARFAREDGKTLSDKTIGSVHYISPEQARGDITDEKSDIYSVGAMMYEMLTGEKPFEADTPIAVALMHMQENAKNPTEIVDSIPKGLEEIVLHAMQKDASKRYQSASEMIKDMDVFKQNPQIIFGYNSLKKKNKDSATIYFNPITKSAPSVKTEKVVKKSNVKVYEEDDDDDDYEDESSGSSLIVSVLSGVAIAVVIVAVFVISIVLLNKIGKTDEKVVMPDLVGQKYNDVLNQISDFEIQIDPLSSYSDEYEAGVIYWQGKNEGREIVKNEKVLVRVSKGIKLVDVPKVENLKFDNVKEMLEKDGFIVEKQQAFDDNIVKDYVINTDPEAYSQLPYGSTVTVLVSKGPTSQQTEVPSVVGLSEEEAKQILKASNLNAMVIPYDDLEDVGTVVAQVPTANEIVKRDKIVKIYVSTGEIHKKTLNVKFSIPSNATGSYRLDAWCEGIQVGTKDLLNAQEVSLFSMPIQGIGTQTIIIEAKNLSTNKSKKYAEIVIDFDNEQIISDIYDNDAFDEEIETTNTTTPDTTSESNTSSDESTSRSQPYITSSEETTSPEETTTVETTTNPLETSREE